MTAKPQATIAEWQTRARDLDDDDDDDVCHYMYMRWRLKRFCTRTLRGS
jgi:hypothetical protein